MFEDIKTELRRPATAVAVGIAIIGIVAGIATSLYFYYRSVREGKLSYQIEQFQVFDQSSLGSKSNNSNTTLFIVNDQGAKINSNVYAARIKIWNSGTDEIKRESIRIPFDVSIANLASIVSLNIESATRNNVDGFAVDRDGRLTWDHFDPQEGFVLRLVYSANAYCDVSLNGLAVNSSGPTSTKTERETNERNVFTVFLAILAISILIIILRIIYLLLSSPNGMRREVLTTLRSQFGRWSPLVFILLVVAQLLELLGRLFSWSLNPTPPF